jgi:hypothetical protein
MSSITYQQLEDFSLMARRFNTTPLAQNKFQAAIQIVSGQFPDILRGYHQSQQLINMELAFEQDGYLIKDAYGNYTYTKADEQKRTKRLMDLKATVVADFKPFFSPSLPLEGFSPQEAKAFRGIVITHEQAQAYIHPNIDSLID